MSTEAIFTAVDLGERMKHVLVATADDRGMPHLAAVSENRIAVEAWFCPSTVENVRNNPMISVVARRIHLVRPKPGGGAADHEDRPGAAGDLSLRGIGGFSFPVYSKKTGFSLKPDRCIHDFRSSGK